MATTYKVKKGDTRDKIAANLGVSANDITGYQSGDPNKIYEGETLTINTPAQQRASEISSALGANTQKTTDIGQNNAPTTTEIGQNGEKITPTTTFNADKAYDSASLTKIATEAKTKKDQLYTELQDFETKTYNNEYANAGLKDIKTNVANLDKQIAQKKRDLAASIAQASYNPGASAATITGEIGRISDKLKGELQNLIDERNSYATQYNDGISEIKTKVGNAVSDKKRTYDYYDAQEKAANEMLGKYREAIISELNTKTSTDAELEKALKLAKLKNVTDTGEWLSPTESTQANVPYGTSKAEAKAIIAARPKDTSLKDTARSSAEELLRKMDAGEGTSAVGRSNLFGLATVIPGTEARDFQNQFNNLKSLLSLDNVKLLKGQGQVSDAERALLAAASANLDLGQSEEEFKKNLQDIIKSLSGKTTEQASGDKTITSPSGESYDLSTYATDPTHATGTQAIIDGIGKLSSPNEVDTYIKSKVPSSPITSAMITKAAQDNGVGWEELIALLQQESGLGTTGLGAKTNNPGNVGNEDGGKTKTFQSLQDGVDAAAYELAKRKIANQQTNQKYTPGQIVEYKGQQYKIGADGETLEPIQ